LLTKILISTGTAGTIIIGFSAIRRLLNGEELGSYVVAPVFVVILLVGVYMKYGKKEKPGE
jgi:hypothetical protein